VSPVLPACAAAKFWSLNFFRAWPAHAARCPLAAARWPLPAARCPTTGREMGKRAAGFLQVKTIFDLRKEERHAISQGQYWLAVDAAAARRALEQGECLSEATVAQVLAERAAPESITVHGRRLARLNGASHLSAPR